MSDNCQLAVSGWCAIVVLASISGASKDKPSLTPGSCAGDNTEVQDGLCQKPAAVSGFWYRRTCRHIIAYREAVALVEAQDAVNVTWER